MAQQRQQQGNEGGTRISLFHHIATRDGSLTKDSKLVNMFGEASETGNASVKRPGTSLVRATASGTSQGLFRVSGGAWAIQNDTLYNVGTGATISIPSVTTHGQPYDCLSDAPYGTSLLKSPSGLWKFNGTTCTKVTDTNYPATTVSGITYLDGTYYVMASDGTVRGSVLQDPLTWPALSFLGADSSLGLGTAVSRHLNYIVAYYQDGVQFYYDAGNSPGIALGIVGNAMWRTGCPNGASIVETNDLTFYLSKSSNRGRSVTQFNGLTPVIISNPFVDRILNRSSLAGLRAFSLKTSGHTFYILTLPDIDITLACDVITGEWAQWTSTVGGVEQAFTAVSCVSTATQDLLQDSTSGAVVAMDTTTYSDLTGPIAARIVTPEFSWGSPKRKRYAAVFLVADTTPSTASLRYSDDDYTTFSSWRSIDLSTVRKMLQRLGSGRRRSWELLHTAATPLRVYQLEMELSVGFA